MEKVRAKKHLGQHFLKDLQAAQRIADLLADRIIDRVIEIGPGMGVMTKYLYPVWKEKLTCVEIDGESVKFLRQQDWAADLQILEGDFLKLPVTDLFENTQTAVIGNYPYNISTQIAFRVIENRMQVPVFAGMFQREVAQRFCAPHGNKEYGVTSVLLQAWYDCEYIFTVNEGAFQPPPKVKSGVMRCIRKETEPGCTEKALFLIVKTAFNQRRKTLSNALKSLTSSRPSFTIPEEWTGLRPEQLSVQNFIRLAQIWDNAK